MFYITSQRFCTGLFSGASADGGFCGSLEAELRRNAPLLCSILQDCYIGRTTVDVKNYARGMVTYSSVR
eukprot:4927102-Ditylum_brightwellii.AAC.1